MSNKYYAVVRSTDNHLEHYGIPGMKWGVRRYIDKNGNLTPAGMKRYSPKATKKTSARKIQRDFNRLEKSYADVNAERIDNRTMGINNMAMAIYKKHKNPNADVSKYKKYADKSIEKDKLFDKQLKGIESLQNRIIGTAAKNKYDVSSEPVTRVGLSRGDRLDRFFGSVNPFPVIGTGSMKTKVVDGQKIRVNKKGTGKVQLVNYYNANHPRKKKR